MIAPAQYWATDPESWYVHNEKKLVSELLGGGKARRSSRNGATPSPTDDAVFQRH